MEVVTAALVILAGFTTPAHPVRGKMTSERPSAVSPLPKPLRNVLLEMPISYLTDLKRENVRIWRELLIINRS
jgi:hypothetical protein